MNNNIIDPFSVMALNVLPQVGFSDIKLGAIDECDKLINTPGVIVIIGVIGDLHGNVILAMSEDCAKFIASTMMMGMPIDEFDDMAQSAVSELGNMLIANYCIELSSKDLSAEISTPTLIYGDFTTNATFEPVIRIELFINDFPFYIYVSLEQK